MGERGFSPNEPVGSYIPESKGISDSDAFA